MKELPLSSYNPMPFTISGASYLDFQQITSPSSEGSRNPLTIFGLNRDTYKDRSVITIFPAIYSPRICIRQLDAMPATLNDMAVELFTITHFHIYFSRIAGEGSIIPGKVLQDVIQFVAKWFGCLYSLTLLFRDHNIHMVRLAYFFFVSQDDK
jgi:hypothetical protein